VITTVVGLCGCCEVKEAVLVPAQFYKLLKGVSNILKMEFVSNMRARKQGFFARFVVVSAWFLKFSKGFKIESWVQN
jgi:hypothetical protein